MCDSSDFHRSVWVLDSLHHQDIISLEDGESFKTYLRISSEEVVAWWFIPFLWACWIATFIRRVYGSHPPNFYHFWLLLLGIILNPWSCNRVQRCVIQYWFAQINFYSTVIYLHYLRFLGIRKDFHVAFLNQFSSSFFPCFHCFVPQTPFTDTAPFRSQHLCRRCCRCQWAIQKLRKLNMRMECSKHEGKHQNFWKFEFKIFIPCFSFYSFFLLTDLRILFPGYFMSSFRCD